MNNDILTFVLVAVITLFGSYIQGVTGFGFGIFSMMFLPHILLYTEGNLLSSTLSSLSSLFTVILIIRNVNWKNLLFPVLGCLLSTYMAVSFIKTQNSKTLVMLLGIALVILSVYFFFFTDKIKIKATWYSGFTAGIVSGIMGGMFAIGGPPVVIYFIQSEESSEKYVATISAYFVFSGIISVTSKVAAGFFTQNVMYGFLFGLIGMLTGVVAGKLTRDKIRSHLLKKLVYGFMAISGVINVVSSLV